MEGYFESRLRSHPPSCIEELNLWAYRWAKEFQARRKHSRHGRTRFDLWVGQMGDFPLRVPPDLQAFRSLAERAPDKRKVSNGYVRWANCLIYIGDFAPEGAEVAVTADLWDSSIVRIRFEGALLETRLPEFDEAGFRVDAPVIGEEFKRRADPASLRLLKEADGLPEAPPSPMSLPESHIKYVLPRTVEVDAPVDDPEIPLASALGDIARALGRFITPAENNAVRRRFGPRIRKSRLDKVIAFIRVREQEGGS